MARFSLNNVKMRNKLLLMYIFSVFIPIVATNVIFYQVITENMKEQKIKDLSADMEKIKNNVQTKIDDAVGISSVFFTDQVLNDDMQQNYDSPIDYLANYTYIRNQLNKYSPIYKSIQSIEIYTDNPTVIDSGGISGITNEIKSEDWYKTLMSANTSGPVIFAASGAGQDQATFSILRKLDYFDSMPEHHNILKINLADEAVKQAFDSNFLEDYLYLLDGSHRLRYTTNPGGTKIGDAWAEDKDVPEGSVRLEKDFANIRYMESWRIIGDVSDKRILEEVRKSKAFVVYLACINLLLPTLIIVWISRSVHIRLVRILKHMKRVKNQHFEIIAHELAKDEIGQLTLEFNRMTLQIKSLIEDVYMADIQKKDLELKRKQAQLHALQSQINPHFLYNTLETIRMRSLMKSEEETAKIIKNMAKMFRRLLTWGKDWVTVRDELELILSFLEIQKYRFGDKLDYRIHVDEACLDCRLPKLTLLPFVENASIHGIEPIPYTGIIEISIEQAGDQLVFILTDNGPGMNAEELERILKGFDDEEEMEGHIGMKNVYYRLKLYYGDGHLFHIHSEAGKGTRVEIRIPMLF